MSKIVEEVCRTIRAAIEEQYRTGRLIALILVTTMCIVLLRLG